MYIPYTVHISRENSQHLEIVMGASGVQCHLHLHSEFESSPSYPRPSQKKIIIKKTLYVCVYIYV